MNAKQARIKPYSAGQDLTHYAIFRGDELIAFCHYEESAIAVRDDANRRAGLLNESEVDLCSE